ncbi:MAG: hypothetical protein KF830_14055 [Planctomycetes bacterium]|nr:hypothetical protein [Planctomycetota bacterium]
MRCPALARLPFVLAIGLAPCGAQVDTPPPPAASAPQAAAPEPLDAATQQALEGLATRLQQRRRERDCARERGDLAAAATLDQEVRNLGWQFAGLVTRIDVQAFEEPQARRFDLQQELEQLLRPLLQAVKDATEEPRQVADLKARLEQLELRQHTAEAALRAAESARAQLPADGLARAEADREIERRWRPQLDALRGEQLVLRARLGMRQDQQKSLPDRVADASLRFLRSSGASLVLATGVFLVVFFGLRLLSGWLLQRLGQDRGFSLRLLEVLLQVFGLLAAVAATILVPYVRNDWLLLAVGIVFLVGAGWVLVRTLPQSYEQIRLLLNVGGVREGERILLDGLPYRVEALRFYSRLHNPDLDGGTLRLPLRHLVGRRSRAAAADEPWFPCRTGDVVLLADGAFGPVRQQTPELVVVEHLGSPRTYRTTTFLAQTPRNLSRGFVLTTTIGLDHGHGQDAVGPIPDRLQKALQQGLAQALGDGALRSVRVELTAALPSALQLRAVVDFDGSAAPHYLHLESQLQGLLVAACAANGWPIALPQLRLHQGGSPGAAGGGPAAPRL